MSKPLDPLLERINSIKKRADANEYSRKKTAAQSVGGRAEKRLTALHWFLIQFARAWWWAWNHVFYYIWRAFSWPIRAGWGLFRWLWDRFVYVDDGFGKKNFSVTRGGLMIVAALSLYWVLPFVLEATWDMSLYAATAKHERLYLTNSQEIDAQDNVHSIQGCSDLPCSDTNSNYYRIRSSGFHQVWSMLHHGSITALFYPDFVAAAVPIGLSDCTVISYGIRAKIFVRNINIYPDLLAATCEPVFLEGKTK